MAAKSQRLFLSPRIQHSPVEDAAEPDESQASGVGGTLRLDLALLIVGQLLASEEIFSHQSWLRAQTQHEPTSGSKQKGQQRTRHGTKVVGKATHVPPDDLIRLQ
jgi:hypothetical protein